MMNRQLRLIGLTGVAENSEGVRIGSARVGKDEIARLLGEVFHTHTRLAFADPLYRIAHHAFGIPNSILGNPTVFEKEEKVYSPWGMTLRGILQTIGTELFRDNVDPDFWVKRLNMELEQTSGNVVVTDVRMPNEADLIRSRGGVIIHVHRKIDTGKVKAHRSEATVPVQAGDLHLYNYGSVDDLKDLVEHQIVNQL